MSARFVNQGPGVVDLLNYGGHAGIKVDTDDDTLKFKDENGVVHAVAAQDGVGVAGLLITKSVRFVENGAGTSYTGTVPIPAGAVIHDIKVIAEALWNGTSATGKVGDTADDDGYFIGINLKATDLLVNEVLSIMESGLWGGKEGAYLVAASGRRGPTTTNFGLYYAAGSNITMVITPGAADGTLGRTVFSVTYSVGAVIAPVVV